MSEIICLHCMEEPKLPKLKLESVMPLLEYLNALPQESCDRELSWNEDETACYILSRLYLPVQAPKLYGLIGHYIDPEYRKSRTLSVWYGIARAVARLVQDGD